MGDFLAIELMTFFASHDTDHGKLNGWQRDKKTGLIVEKEQGGIIKRQKAQFTVTPYRPARESDYIWHLTAAQDEPRGIGCYPLHTDGLARFGCVDLDEDSERAERAIRFAATMAIQLGAHPYLEQTTRGGWHLFLFTPEGSDGQKMLTALRALAQAVVAHGAPAETYPAAFNLAPRSGRYVNLPYRGAGRDGEKYLYGETWLEDPKVTPRTPIAVSNLSYELVATDEKAVSLIASFYRPPQETRRQRQTRDTANSSGDKLFEAVVEGLMKSPPSKGNRHECLLAAAGVARRKDVAEETAVRELKGVTDAWGSEPGRDWDGEVERAVKRTYETTGVTSGLTTLIKYGLKL